MADLRISELQPLLPSDAVAQDQLAIADTSASETKKIATKDLGSTIVRLLDANEIPADKVDLGALNIDGSTIIDGSIPGSKLEENSITNRELAANSVDLENIVNGAVNANKLSNDIAERGLSHDPTTNKIGHENQAANGAGTFAGISYDQYGHITDATGPIPTTDLPIATTDTVGVVSIPSDGGLSVSPIGSVTHSNSVSGQTYGGITYDDHGHITGVDASGKIPADDLPTAGTTVDELGAVYVPATDSNPLQVAADGALTHAEVGANGTYPKVVVDQYGHVTAGQSLLVDDIPDLPISKITGEIDGTNIIIGPDMVTREMLADYAISYIQEAEPTSVDPGHIGCLWFQESTAQLRMWNGNSWMAVGFGRLSQDNLRWGGTIDASTGLITILTEAGISAGLTVGMAPPAASDPLGGLYLVVDTDGSNISVTPGVAYTSQDWCLCVNELEGWIRIDSNGGGGGGGGGAQRLDDLLDVNVTNPEDGALLAFQAASNTWVYATVLDGGTF